MSIRIVLVALLIVSAPGALRAQSLEQRVARVADGTVHLSFAARPGVCGSGTSINLRDGENEREYECGQPQVEVAFGFLMVNPPPVTVSTKSTSAPLRYRMLMGSTYRVTPFD